MIPTPGSQDYHSQNVSNTTVATNNGPSYNGLARSAGPTSVSDASAVILFQNSFTVIMKITNPN